MVGRRLLPVAAALCMAVGLVGCASNPVDARSKPPTLELTSAKDAKTVAGCIATAWESAYRVSSPRSRPSVGGYAVWIEDSVGLGKDVPFVADVDDTKSGSATRYYSNAISAKAMDKTVVDCQK